MSEENEVEEKLLTLETHNVCLTKGELVYLRDLFGLLLPNQYSTSISEGLAHATDRAPTERRLWSKIAEACAGMNIPVGDSAPNYSLAADGPPNLEVVNIDENEEEEEEDTDADAYADQVMSQLEKTFGFNKEDSDAEEGKD